MSLSTVYVYIMIGQIGFLLLHQNPCRCVMALGDLTENQILIH